MSSVPVGPGKESTAVGQQDGMLPVMPIRSKAAMWVPRTATVGLLGLSLWRSQQYQGALQGVAALASALFGSSPFDRHVATQTAFGLASPLLVWTVEEYRSSKAISPLVL